MSDVLSTSDNSSEGQTGAWRSTHLGDIRSPRRKKRWLATLTLLALLGCFVFALVSPFSSKSTVLVVGWLEYPTLRTNASPLRESDIQALHDVGRFASVRLVMNNNPDRDPHEAINRLAPDAGPNVWRNMLSDTSDEPPSAPLIVYVAGVGVCIDDEPFLLTDQFQPGSPEDGVIPVNRLLHELSDHPSQLKLLVVDLVTDDRDASYGINADRFPSQLAKLVSDTDDPSIHVLLSHSDFQCSHYSPTLRRSLFTACFLWGLQGAADLDDDRCVTVPELGEFVRQQVATRVSQVSDGKRCQLPMLIHGRKLHTGNRDTSVLVTVHHPPDKKHPWQPESVFAGEEGKIAIDWNTISRIPSVEQVVAKQSALGSIPASNLAGSTPPTMGTPPLPTASPLPANSQPAVPASTAKVDGAVGRHADVVAEPAPDASTANGDASQDQSASGSTTASGSRPPSEAENDEPSPRAVAAIQRRLDMADLAACALDGWALRDALLGRDDIDVLAEFPQAWRVFQHQLLGAQQCARENSEVDYQAMLRKTRQTLRHWQATADNRPITAVRGDDFSAAPNSELRVAEEELNRVIVENNPQLLERWITTSWQPEFMRHPVLADIHALFASPDVSTATLCDFLFTKQLGDRALCWEAANWSATAWQDAERLLALADCMIHDRVRNDWEIVCSESLQKARASYRQCGEDADRIQRMQRFYRRLVDRAPDYVDWYQRTNGDPRLAGPDFMTLNRFLELLVELADKLEHPDASSLDDLQRAAILLHELSQAIESGADDDAVARRIARPRIAQQGIYFESILATSIPNTHNRLRLLNAADLGQRLAVGTSENDAPGIAVQSSISNVDHQLIRSRRLLLQARILQLGMAEWSASRPEGDALLKQLAGYVPTTLQMPSQEAVPMTLRAIEECEAQLEQMYVHMVAEIDRLSGLPPRASAADEWKRVRQLDRMLRVVDARDAVTRQTISTLRPMQRCELHCVLSQHWLRYQRIQQLADKKRGRTCAVLLEMLKDSLVALFPEMPGQGVRSSTLLVEPVEAANLRQQTRGTVSLSIESFAKTPQDIWIITEDDDKAVRIVPATELPVRDVHELPSTALVISDWQEGLPATLTLAPGRRVHVPINIERGNSPDGDASIIVRVVTRDSFVRVDVPVHLPSQPPVQVVAQAVDADVVETSDGCEVILPPNRDTPLSLSLKNVTTQPATVDVALWALAPQADIAGLLGEHSAQTLVGGMQFPTEGSPLAELAGVEIAAGQQIPFALPKYTAPLPESPDSSASQVSLHGDLLVTITDRARQQVWWRVVRISVARPSSYVLVTANRDPQSGAVDLVATASDLKAIPAAGIRVVASFNRPTPSESLSKMAGIIKGPSGQLRLRFQPDFEPHADDRLYVSIDGYPRAYRFDLLTNEGDGRMRQSVDDMSLRITSPSNGAIVSDRSLATAIELQVDAPLHSFDPVTRSSWCVLGLDLDRNRRLYGEPQWRLFADRQVTTQVRKMTPTGSLVLHAEVSDHVVEVPWRDQASGEVAIVANMFVDGVRCEAAPISLTADFDPPKIAIVQFDSGTEIPCNHPLTLSVVADDGHQSGIAIVEGTLAPWGAQAFPQEATVVRAEWQDGLAWKCTIPADEKRRGPMTLLLRATDRAGHVSDVYRQEIAFAGPAPITAAVRGTVQFRGQLASDADVSLVAVEGDSRVKPVRTNSQGAFEFVDVPAGKYLLTARLVFVNRPRSVQQQLELKGPEPAPPRKLIIPFP
ncbi:MAG: hypothetical protein R3E01_18240 [Pirellulaceae bacterium]|nr:hypothetical protein [Planctomycetales bacterium]